MEKEQDLSNSSTTSVSISEAKINLDSQGTPDQASPNISNPHDKGYKSDLSIPSEFLHFLKKYIRADWTKDLEVSQLHLADKEFITKDFEGKESDLIYDITLRDQKKIFIFVLQKLQSSVDFTMIFRILIYIFHILMRYFLATDPKIRTQKDFRLPAVIPIVFYNGSKPWTAIRELKNYQMEGGIFGEYVLNLKYYLIDLNKIDEQYILSTNTLIDNIMYCDKFRQKAELIDALQEAFERVEQLGRQQQKQFEDWVHGILLAICGENEKEVRQILENTRKKGDTNMAFQYNIIRTFELERAQAREEGHAEGLAEGHAESLISITRKKILKNLSAEEIADMLETDVDRISEICTLVQKYPEKSDMEIYRELGKVGHGV